METLSSVFHPEFFDAEATAADALNQSTAIWKEFAFAYFENGPNCV